MRSVASCSRPCAAERKSARVKIFLDGLGDRAIREDKQKIDPGTPGTTQEERA